MVWWQVIVVIWGVLALGILCEIGWIISRGFKDVLIGIKGLETELKRHTEQSAYITTLLRTNGNGRQSTGKREQ